MSDLENSLPEKWVLTQINELFIPIDGNRTLGQGWSPQCEKEPSTSEDDWGVLKTTAIQAGSFHPEHNKKLPKHLAPRPSLEVAVGDFLITCAGPRNRCGVACLVRSTRKQLMISGKMYRFRLKPELIDSKYAEAYFQTQYAQIEIDAMKTGGSDSGLNLTHERFRKLQIPLAPLNEQTRIVSEIEKQFSRLDEAVANLKRVKANLKRYKAAVLKAAVEGKLTEEWRRQHPDVEPADKLLERILAERRKAAGKGKYKEPVAPDTSGLPELPAGWVWASLPQLGELNRGKSKHRPRDDKRLFDGSYPFIQTGEVRKSEGTIREYSQTYSEFGLQQSKLWPAGTLCITIAANIAETGILTFSACFPDSVVGFLNENYPATTRYVEYFIRTAKENLERFAPATAQKNINLEVLENVAVPLPPLTEQLQIVAEVERRLSIVAEAEAEVDNNLRRADRLRQSILKQAFSGQLVTQDPDDEPARLLVERIRSEVGTRRALTTTNAERPKRAQRAALLRNSEPKPIASDFASLDAICNAIFDLMQPDKKYSRADLADPLGLSTGRWNITIRELKRRGMVWQLGEKRGALYMRAKL